MLAQALVQAYKVRMSGLKHSSRQASNYVPAAFYLQLNTQAPQTLVQNNGGSLVDLPQDVVCSVSRLLSPLELAAMQSCCKYLHAALQDEG